MLYEYIIAEMYEDEMGEDYYMLSDDEKAEYYNDHYYEAMAIANSRT